MEWPPKWLQFGILTTGIVMATLFTRVCLRDELSSKPDIEWAINQIIPKIGTTLIVGESGTGKTFLAFWLAACMAYGNKFVETTFKPSILEQPVGQPNKRGATLYIVGEGLSGLHLRAQGVEDAVKLINPNAAQLPLIVAEADSIGLDGNCTPYEVWKNIERELEKLNLLGHDIEMIVIDTVPACFLLDDENNNPKIQGFGNFFKRLSAYFQCPVVALMHPAKKGPKKSPRGAGSIFASADAALLITKNGNSRKRTVQVTKIRDGLSDGQSFNFDLKTFGNSAALLPNLTEPTTVNIIDPIEPPPDYYPAILSVALDCIPDGHTIKARIAKYYLEYAESIGEEITKSNSNQRTRRALDYYVSESQLDFNGKHYSLPAAPSSNVTQTD